MEIYKVLAIGEALIDFIACETGVSVSRAGSFQKTPGGAPANAAAAVAKLGGHAQMVTMLGQDPFGEYLAEKMQEAGISCRSVLRTEKAGTALAFVSLQADGERDFSFYRNPSADMLLAPGDIKEEWFAAGDILHFGSVDLIDMPVRKAHDAAIRIAKQKKMRISFDPNIRLPLWKDHTEYRQVVRRYIRHADILKVSSDELEFITGIRREEEAIASLRQEAGLLLYTKGRHGAELYTKTEKASHPGFSVGAVDTTGAGDAFIGSFLYQLLWDGGEAGKERKTYEEMLAFSNAAAAIATTRKGGMEAMPAYAEVEALCRGSLAL